MNLDEAIAQVEGMKHLGTKCPCCKQWVQIYKRRIKSREAAWLIQLVRKHAAESRYYHIDEMKYGRGDEAKLLHWGLIDDKVNADTKKRRSGLWMPTELGIAFVHEKVKVIKHLFLFNQEFEGWADETDLVTIKDCLRRDFDYELLMRGEL